MTPFDPAALLAMLLAFYPPSASSFARARSERPAYFAGGVIVGTGGDKLRLPDGRVWDCIYDVDGLSGGPRWQAIDVTDGGDTPSPYPLEPGPLAPVDLGAWPGPRAARDFEALVAGAASDLAGADTGAGRARDTIAGASSPAALEAAFADQVVPAAGEVDGQIAAAWQLDPSGLIITTRDQRGRIDQEQGEYPSGDAPDVPAYDPGPRPHDGGAGDGEAPPEV